MSRIAGRVCLAVFLSLILRGAAAAQLIGVKSIPVAAGDQFRIQPSSNAALGDLSIALIDPLLDPWINPAAGSRWTEPRLWVAPMFYSVSGDDGSVRTLPAGASFTGRSWFGGLSFTLQQVNGAQPRQPIFVRQVLPGALQAPLRDRASNMYATALLGARIPGTRLSVGASASLADLTAVDGVDLLYALSSNIEQTGHIADFRVGVTGETAIGGEFQAILLHNRFAMTHEVTYQEWWAVDPVPCEVSCGQPGSRTETNHDRTNAWGVHLGYRRPVGDHGWTVGGILTANRQTHPGIPNYEIANIPRDPGTSWAWNFGLGAARAFGPAVFGVDVIWEPIASHTWAEAASEIVTPDGRRIRGGEKTVDNEFDFANAIVRIGAGRETDRWGFQLGLHVHSYSYGLDQHDIVLDTRRRQNESWMEWTPTWGAALKFPELEIRYAGRLTTGTGRPGVAWGGNAWGRLDAATNFIVAPSGPLTLQDATVLTHQLTVSLPIR